jgi:O-antigen ligase
MFLLAAYPTVFQDLGVLTINNLLGIVLAVALMSYILTTRDLSFLRQRHFLLLAAIGIALVVSITHAGVIFPNMHPSQSLGVKGKALDRTSDMVHDFFARLIFLAFLIVFVRRRQDVSALFWVYVLVLFLAVPSALINWWNGELGHGFRAEASITAGANANRLAMICLMEGACWWCWLQLRPTAGRWMVAGVAIVGAFLVVLATGSRSGLLGLGLFAFLLQTGPRRFRATSVHITLAVAAAAFAVVAVVPPEAWERMLTVSADPHAVSDVAERGAASSLELRRDTIEIGFQMIRDHPLLGIGLGNYREVSRQVYLDPFFRPPHNSVIWAAAEGGVFVLGGYVLLFTMAWRDLRVINRLAPRDPRVSYMVASLRILIILYGFFSVLADLWLNPITYVLLGLLITLRRYLEGLPSLPSLGPAVAVAG